MIFKLKIAWFLLQFTLRNDKGKSLKQLARIKERRYRRMLGRLSASPFYKARAATSPPLSAFPVIDKKIFMENFDQINTRSIKKDEALQLADQAEESRDFTKTLRGVTVGLSSGTSGNRGIFLASETERARWVAVALHRIIGFSLKKRTIAFFLRSNSPLYESANSTNLNFVFFDLMQPHEENMQALASLKADILVAQPSALLRITRSFTEMNITPGFRKVISVAEVLDLHIQESLEQFFGLKIDQVYQCTEGLLASTCKHGQLHMNEDFLIIEKEYLDEDKTRFIPIITDLYRRTQPVIRYRLNDILHEGQHCSCGSNFLLITQIEGREDDIVRMDDKDGHSVDIYPGFLTRAVSGASPDIEEFQIVQTGKNELTVSFSTSSNSKLSIEKEIGRSIQSLCAKFNIINCNLHYAEPEKEEKACKLRRVRNEYNKIH